MREISSPEPEHFHFITQILSKDHVIAIWRASAGVQRAKNARNREIFLDASCWSLTGWVAEWMAGLLYYWFRWIYPMLFKVYTTIVPLAFFHTFARRLFS